MKPKKKRRYRQTDVMAEVIIRLILLYK